MGQDLSASCALSVVLGKLTNNGRFPASQESTVNFKLSEVVRHNGSYTGLVLVLTALLKTERLPSQLQGVRSG